MVASLRGNVGTGTNEDESSTGCVWDAGVHHVMARSRLARVLKLMNGLVFNFPVFLFRPWSTADNRNRGYEDPLVFPFYWNLEVVK